MIEMLQYGFMQRAFITGILLAVIAPLIGITIVLKRMSMIGDALSHASLAGVALGLLLGINPILGAMGICLFAALGVEAIRRKIPRYSEMAISIIMSTGIGLAGILSGFVKNGTNFNSFLFGSIISISKDELKIVCVISVLVLLCVLLLYKELFYIGFDENAARISGVPVKTINFIFTLLTALTVSIASRTVGTLIVSSMLVIILKQCLDHNIVPMIIRDIHKAEYNRYLNKAQHEQDYKGLEAYFEKEQKYYQESTIPMIFDFDEL